MENPRGRGGPRGGRGGPGGGRGGQGQGGQGGGGRGGQGGGYGGGRGGGGGGYSQDGGHRGGGRGGYQGQRPLGDDRQQGDRQYGGQGGGRGGGRGGYHGDDGGNRGRGGFQQGGRGRGGRGGGGGGGMGSGNYMPRGDPDAVEVIQTGVRRMQLAPREFIDMAEAKEMTISRPTHITSKKGSTGTPVDLEANFFQIKTKANWDIHQYRVDFAPDIPDTRIRKALVAMNKAAIGGNCFDGTMLFTVKPLTKLEIATKMDNGDVIVIKIRSTGVMSRTDQRFLQIYNIILNKAMSGLKLTQLGRDYYDSGAAIRIENWGIELWPGYITSIRQHENDVLLNVDIGYKFLRLQTIRHLFGEAGNNVVRMTNMAVGQIVITDYNNKTYRIDRIDFEKTPQSTFDCQGKQVSYIQYYLDRYKIKIQDPQQPLLVSKTTARQRRGGMPEEVYLIPELCRLTGMTDEMRNNRMLTRDLSAYTRVNPEGRQRRLMDFSNRMATSKQTQDMFGEFGMTMEKSLVRIKGRVLPPENILFAGGKKFFADRADWTSAFQKRMQPFSNRDALRNWYVFTNNRCRRETEHFIGKMQQVSQGLGIQFEWPQIVELQSDRPQDYIRELDRVCAMDPLFLVCVVSNDSADRYSAIKKALSVKRAVLSQVILQRTVTERNESKMMSVATKVMIQISCKLGNAPWKVAIPIGGTMFIGFDVCHDTRDRSRSFAAFIASMDQSRSDVFYSAGKAHTNGEELCSSFGQMVEQAVRCYQNIHGELPKRIVVYRDGVGDGQTQFVIDHELSQVKKVLKPFYGDEEVKLAFIIVTKRIKARYYPVSARDNVAPGTVVDDVITLPERYDFFLVSQKVTQGTATPTNYNVIYDKLGLSPDKVQLLTHKLCHLYYNWTGTVRVPNVCQYAHKLSLLLGQYLHEKADDQLSQKLYFL